MERRAGWMVAGLGVMLWAAAGWAVGAEMGSLRVHVRPVQAEVFIDGQHMGDASYDGTVTIHKISAGEHTVSVYTYGYMPATAKVTIEAGKTKGIRIRLAPMAGTVPGPWGKIRIEGAKRPGVLLNGKTADYVVGHAGQFNSKGRELIVPPGTYQMSLVHGTREIWSGPVTVGAGQETIVDVKRNRQRTVEWAAGKSMGELPRFAGGWRSTRVAVGPVNAQFAAEPVALNCGESTRLKWSASGAARTEISGVGEVAAAGEQQVTPKQTTTYTLTAAGPGGTATVNSTVNVNNVFNSQLELSPQEVRYRKIGQKVVEQGSANLTWSTARAEQVRLDPLGPVDATGSRRLQPVPKQTTVGPVNETVTYTLKATNSCGGEETRTATLHLVGTIEPGLSAFESASEFGLALVSVFFPTDYPDPKRPQDGLLKSQQAALARLAATMKKYLEYDSTARMGVEAHSDARASRRHDQLLSERRASRVKDYLVSQGIPAENIDTMAYGKEQPLARTDVKKLEQQNPNAPPKARVQRTRADWWAYNRRVDLILKPTGQRSSQYFPHNAPDSSILWQEPKPRWRIVEKNQ